VIRLCITADDYGLSGDVNAAIHSLVKRGALSAVSVMVHGDAVLEQVAALRPYVATGLHLVLVGERPLLPDRLAPLLDAAGFLPASYWRLFLALARRPLLLPLLGDEIAAQLARYRALGLPLHFINSHQHVHLLPPIWNQMMRTLASADSAAPAVRIAHRAPTGGPRQTLLAASSRLAWTMHPLRGRTALVAIGVDFAGYTTLRDVDDVLRCLARTSDLPDTRFVYELVVHPGFEDHPPAARHGAWRYRWRGEHDLLSSSEFRELLRRHAVVVVRPDAPAGPTRSS